MSKERITLTVVFIALFCILSTSVAEDVACPRSTPDCNPPLSLEAKLRASYGEAVTVVTGSFKLSPIPEIVYMKQVTSSDKAFITTTFSVKERLKDCLGCKDLRFKIVAYASEPNDSLRHLIFTNEYLKTKAELESLENKLEKGDIKEPAYLQELQSLTQKLENNTELLPHGAFLIPIKPRSGDHSYRVADVPISLDQEYLVFLFYSAQENQDKRKTLSPYHMDVYPVNGRIKYEEVLRIINNNKNQNPTR